MARFLLLFVLLPLIVSPDLAELPVCGLYQACASRLSVFPLKSTDTVFEDDVSSGQGSGTHISEPIYDEFVTAVTPFDFEAEPRSTDTRLCRCEGETDDEPSCSFDSSDNVLTIDSTVSLSLCKPVKDTVHSKCFGRRHFVTIIGQLDDNGGLTNITETHVPCTCDSYSRVATEPWTEGFVLSYRCIQD
ncbi:unnamed protein product [Bursaphelenchus okinawaensis]|uniref:Uncharacterized protein n=1 Tax=Bursaphelenchus okinawaensis TaxID=465554 RepID=A0A811JTC4_9BILA|nr:unnamed protein product [Bursaphelenchus okinawaensis]CAG9082088.1 unnamed protein product [Bursaphelenchus okinawaensis]